jgi:chromosome segregation ATPase
MGAVIVTVGLAVTAALFLALWQSARIDRDSAHGDVRAKDAELTEVRSRYAAHSKTVEAGHKERVATLTANAEKLTEKIAGLYKQIEAHDASHAARAGNLVAELKATRQALEKAQRTVAAMREVLDAA